MALATAVSLALATAPAAARTALAVEGVDRTRLLAPAGADVRDYENSGYRLRWVGDEIHIAVESTAIGSISRFTPPGRPCSVGGATDRAVCRLARSLTVGAETQYEAISRILAWMARSITYELDRDQPQNAAAVLERRSGYCTGVARLTVSLLRAVDIPAREVAGYVLPTDQGDPGSGFHRWVEAYLPDRGWTFSDPLRSHHYVPATYLRLASEELATEAGLDGLLLERRDGIDVVDLYPGAVPGITARRNSERRLAAALTVHVEGAHAGLAELTGSGKRRAHTLIDGGTTFVGLEPGCYELRLTSAGGLVERRVDLDGRVRKTLSLPRQALPRQALPRQASPRRAEPGAPGGCEQRLPRAQGGAAGAPGR